MSHKKSIPPRKLNTKSIRDDNREKTSSDQPVYEIPLDSPAGCYTTIAMADRVKALEVSLASLQKQARKIVVNSPAITAEVKQKAIAAVNVKESLFGGLVPVDLTSVDEQFRHKFRNFKQENAREDERRAEEDEDENIPAEVKEARSKLLNIQYEHNMKNWFGDLFQSISICQSDNIVIDDFWEALSFNLNSVS